MDGVWMTQYLWNHPIIFLIVLTGGYFLARSKKVFSQNLHNDTDLDFLINRCEKNVQWEMLSGLLRQFPEHVCFLSLAMLRAAISAGGAGALFWFAVFSLLLKEGFPPCTIIIFASGNRMGAQLWRPKPHCAEKTWAGEKAQPGCCWACKRRCFL